MNRSREFDDIAHCGQFLNVESSTSINVIQDYRIGITSFMF